MDFSASNTSLWDLIILLGIIAGTVLLANILIRKIPFIRKALIPVPVLAGFIMLLFKQTGWYEFNEDLLEVLVFHSIAIGFIAMSLRVVPAKNGVSGNLTGPKSGAIIVGSYLVQAMTGLIISVVLSLTVMPGLFKAAGLLLPMGYGQGPGQANNIGTTYENAGFAGGRSFGLAIAAAGYLCACIVGVIIVNVLAHKGKVAAGRGKLQTSDELSVGYFQDTNEIPVSDSVDKLSVQAALILGVYLLTYLVTLGLTSGISAISEGVGNMLNSLLWGFNFIIGAALAMLVRTIIGGMKKAGIVKRQYQNNYLLNRISGFFFDIMIVAGIASIDLEDLSGLWLPFILIAVAGGIVTWFYLTIVCKKVYPDYYYEGLISMYGMETGTISSGVLLLREIDPEYETPAANNLIMGSSFGIILGAPMLVLVALAIKSDVMCYVAFGICLAYFIVLMLFIFLVNPKKKKEEPKA